MRENAKEIPDKDKDELAELLADGSTPAECAKLLNIHTATVYRWMEEPQVVERIERIREIQWKAFAAQYQKLTEVALKRTEQLIKHDDPEVAQRAIEHHRQVLFLYRQDFKDGKLADMTERTLREKERRNGHGNGLPART